MKVIVAAIIAIVFVALFLSQKISPSKTSVILPPATSSKISSPEVVASNLKIPWEVAFLPGGEIIVTERPGSLFFVKANQRVPVSDVTATGEGGLLGAALHPDFKNNHWLYLYLTTKQGNRVDRYKLEGNTLSDQKIIIEGVPAGGFHDGGRIAFGPDRNLYIGTGDAGNDKNSQNTNSLAGKILRVKDDGGIPADNPFGNAVYSYGHRNVQGLTWDDQGNLWATEHGRSGVLSGLDELNLIEKGKNYGWPVIQGDQRKEGMVSPIIQSGPNVTWAPAGALFASGSIFFAGLRGQTLYEYQISSKTLREHFAREFGRLRAVVLGPDKLLYLTTSNTDGRGTIKDGDDKLIRLDPKNFP